MNTPTEPNAATTVADASARPGDAGDSDVGKQLFKFNVIAVPQSDWVVPDGECTNNGRRIFFERGNGNTLGDIRWQFVPGNTPSWDIEDCDGTSPDDNEAVVSVDESQSFWVMVRLLGPKPSTLQIVCQEIVEEGADDLCVIAGPVNLKRNAMTKIMSNIVDNEYEEVLWSLSGNWRIFEVRIYEKQ
jgi:hypothetical protein